MELEAAREILAEVFWVRLSEVDEMIENRFQAGGEVERRSREDSLWPQELWVKGQGQPLPAGSSLPPPSYMSRYISVQPGAHHRYSPNEHRALGEGSPHITQPSFYPFAVIRH